MNEQQFNNLHHRRKVVYGHPYSNTKCEVYEYRLEVEKAIGRYLKPKEIVHHHYNWDGSATLILCPNVYYHQLLHTREYALRCCGHVNWRKCRYCKKYDDPKHLSIKKTGQVYHLNCAIQDQHNRE
jgi:hypothetical protein